MIALVQSTVQNIPERAGLPLDRLDAHLDARQLLQQRPATGERGFAADHGQQTAPPRTVLHARNVEFAVEPGHASPAIPAVTVGPSRARRAEQADQPLGAWPLAAHGPAAVAQRRLALVVGVLQQCLQPLCPGPVQGRAGR